ncbi:MAG: signal recognition particle receptor subunit alpha, partial [Planctomycetota bacterium]|nr:signal recognition particle receptor subunit alpha [Planctomycetota bacterium]
MFESLTEALGRAFRKLTGKGVLTERNIDEGLREVRQALLAADVNFRVVKDFIESVKQKAIGQEIVRSVKPEQQIVKIVYDELVRLMGPEYQGLSLKTDGISVIMMVGLQGAGKTLSLI